jgi:hypothetical protein
MPFKGYLTVRLLLWFSGVFIAFLPTLLAAPELSINPLESAHIINTAGLFRDLFFIVVPAAVLGLSTSFDFLCVNLTRLSATNGTWSILALMVNIFGLGAGLVGFTLIPHDGKALSGNPLVTYSALIILGLFFSLVTEIGISWMHSVERGPNVTPK